MRHELLKVPLAVRDEADLQGMAAQHRQHRQRVLVQREVLVSLPLPHHVLGARARAGRVAAHAEDDLLGERDPDLLVVHEVALRLQLLDRGRARSLVAARLQVEPVPLPDAAVSLGAELRAGPEEREVDVEEDRLQHAVRIGESRRSREIEGRRAIHSPVGSPA